ncbi:MAG: hypothetical protein ACKOFN_01095 [Vulcanococcus sp.]
MLPLLGAALSGLGLISFNRTVNRLKKPVALLLLTCVGAAAVLSYAVLAEQLAGAAPTEVLFNWASAGSFNLPMGFRVDALGAVMLALVTTIALLVIQSRWVAHQRICPTACVGLIAHHLFAVWNGDRRLANRFGPAFEELRASTSVLPFRAVLDGRQPLVLAEFLRPAQLGIAIAVGVFWWAPRFIGAGATACSRTALAHWLG